MALSSGGKVAAVLGPSTSTQPASNWPARPVPTSCCSPVAPTAATRTGACWGQRFCIASWPGPVVVAGDVAARSAVEVPEGWPNVVADNVVPRIGVLGPEPARRAIREMFLEHVIGGKGLSRRADFTAMVRGATPDLVLTGVEVLAQSGPMWWSSTSGGRRPMCTPSYDWTRRMPGVARGRRDDAGDPHRRGRPRHALERATTWEAGARRAPRTTTTRPPYDAPADPSFLPSTAPSATRTS